MRRDAVAVPSAAGGRGSQAVCHPFLGKWVSPGDVSKPQHLAHQSRVAMWPSDWGSATGHPHWPRPSVCFLDSALWSLISVVGDTACLLSQQSRGSPAMASLFTVFLPQSPASNRQPHGGSSEPRPRGDVVTEAVVVFGDLVSEGPCPTLCPARATLTVLGSEKPRFTSF